MDTVNVTLRIDRQTKQEADQLFSSLGLSFSSAVNTFLQKAIKTRSIPFPIDESPVDKNTELLSKALVALLASEEAQRKIGTIHAGAPAVGNRVLSDEELEKLL